MPEAVQRNVTIAASREEGSASADCNPPRIAPSNASPAMAAIISCGRAANSPASVAPNRPSGRYSAPIATPARHRSRGFSCPSGPAISAAVIAAVVMPWQPNGASSTDRPEMLPTTSFCGTAYPAPRSTAKPGRNCPVIATSISGTAMLTVAARVKCGQVNTGTAKANVTCPHRVCPSRAAITTPASSTTLMAKRGKRRLPISQVTSITPTSIGCWPSDIQVAAPKRNRIPASMAAAMAGGTMRITRSNAPLMARANIPRLASRNAPTASANATPGSEITNSAAPGVDQATETGARVIGLNAMPLMPQPSEIAHTQEETNASGKCAACAAWKTMTIEPEYPARIATSAATMG